MLFTVFALVARAETTLSSFGQTGPYASTRTATVAVPRVSSSTEAGEIFIQYPAGAVVECPLIIFMFPIHGFPFATWRGLLSTVISSLVSNGFCVASPVAVDPDGARPIRGGMFPGTAFTLTGMDLRTIATRYLNFMTHASRYLIERVESDPGFALANVVSVERVGCMGFSVGGALSQYLAQRLSSDRIVGMEVAFAPTIGSETRSRRTTSARNCFANTRRRPPSRRFSSPVKTIKWVVCTIQAYITRNPARRECA